LPYTHSKVPNFSEEFKIEIPPNLHERQYLLFTFHHVAFQKKVDGESHYQADQRPTAWGVQGGRRWPQAARPASGCCERRITNMYRVK
jgi:hypothetical protein